LTQIISNSKQNDKLVLWENITNIIQQLNQLKIITVQRTCQKCKHFSEEKNKSFCNLLNQNLKTEDIRIDCEEFEQNVV
jgi:hypothetical protein